MSDCPVPVKTNVGQVDLVLRSFDGTSEKISFLHALMKFKDIDKIKVAISEMLYLKYKNKNHSLNGHVKIIGYQFGAKFKLVFCAKYERT